MSWARLFFGTFVRQEDPGPQKDSHCQMALNVNSHKKKHLHTAPPAGPANKSMIHYLQLYAVPLSVASFARRAAKQRPRIYRHTLIMGG